MEQPTEIRNRCFGYARVSTDDQNLSLQIDALIRFGVEPNDIFSDKISGATSERPGLDSCLSHLKPGDTLVVWRLGRLGWHVGLAGLRVGDAVAFLFITCLARICRFIIVY